MKLELCDYNKDKRQLINYNKILTIHYTEEQRRRLSILILNIIATFYFTFQRIFRGSVSSRQMGVVSKIVATNA